MKCLLLFFLSLLLLVGCSAKTEINALNSATEEVSALEATLTPECKTNAVQGQINAIKATIKSANDECELKIQSVESESIKWKTAFFGLLLVIVIYIAKKII